MRVDGHGADLGAAVDDAATLLHARPQTRTNADRARPCADPGRRDRGRTRRSAAALADGDARAARRRDPARTQSGHRWHRRGVADKTALVLPHELVMAKLLSTKRPSDTMGDFAMGVDLDRIAAMVGARGGTKLEARRAVPVSHRHVRRGSRQHEATAPALSRHPTGAAAERGEPPRGGARGRALPGRSPRAERALRLRARPHHRA